MDQELEVMRVLRVPPRGGLVVAVGVQRFGSLEEVLAPELKQRLIAAVGELITFAGGYDALVEAGVAPAISGMAADESDDVVDPELERRRAAFIESLERERDAIKAVAEESAAEQSSQEQATKPQTGPLAEPAVDIVTEINEVLQLQLQDHPALAGRVIQLEHAPQGGLRILVDGEYFNRPSDVSDDEARQALQAALRHWEAR